MIILLVGAPGAGKGTQADALRDQLGLHKISTGDALRHEVQNRTPLGLQIESIMASGHLVSDEILGNVLISQFKNTDRKHILLDGYPRNLAQAEWLTEAAKEFGGVARVVFLDVDDGVVIERLTGRRVCKKCQATYHLKSMPPRLDMICDACSGELVTRPDDDEAKIRLRLGVYARETKPVLDFYTKKNLVERVDAAKSSAEVLEKILAIVSRALEMGPRK